MDKLPALWLQSSPVKGLMSLFSDAEAFFVGGCVRNPLLGLKATDFDLATPLLPNVVLQRAEAAGFRAIPTGIDHGTVTVVVEGEPFEVTTFRSDIETDGRHAQVQYSDSLEEDARRRDFTMNAIYADRDGRLFDPVGGIADLRARKLRFIGDAEQRIREDYLRILRFFRFHAWYGDDALGLEVDALAACAAQLDGLDQLSRERVGSEMLKLLQAEDPTFAVAAMSQTGVLQAVLPGAQIEQFLVLSELALENDPILRLSTLAASSDAPDLRLSKQQAKLYVRIREAGAGTQNLPKLAFENGAYFARLVASFRAALFEQPVSPSDVAEMEKAAQQVFPVSASDLPKALVGREIGEALTALQDRWIASGFELTKADLLAGLETK